MDGEVTITPPSCMSHHLVRLTVLACRPPHREERAETLADGTRVRPYRITVHEHDLRDDDHAWLAEFADPQPSGLQPHERVFRVLRTMENEQLYGKLPHGPTPVVVSMRGDDYALVMDYRPAGSVIRHKPLAPPPAALRVITLDEIIEATSRAIFGAAFVPRPTLNAAVRRELHVDPAFTGELV